MKHLILATSAMVGLFAIGQPALAEEESAVRPALFEVASRESPTAMRFIGIVDARESTRYAFRVGGRLVARDVSVGDAVTEGQVLARLDSTLLALAVDNAEANLAVARAQHDNAVTAAARMQALFEANSAPRASLDRAREQAQAALSSVAQANAQLTQAQDQVAQAQISARFAGVVTQVSADPGQVVGAGQPIVTIAKPDVRDIVINVPEGVAGELKIGAEAQVWPQLDPASIVTGIVREIAPEANTTTRLWQVKIGIDQPPHSLWLGTTAVADFGDGDSGAVTVPESAILQSAAGSELWIIDPESHTVSSRVVTTGATQDGRIEITDGLVSGEYFAVAGAHTLQEGQEVRLEGQE